MTFIDKLVGAQGQQALYELQLRDLRLWRQLVNLVSEMARAESPRLRFLLSHLPSLPAELADGINTDLLNRMDVFYQHLWQGIKNRLEKQLANNAMLEEQMLPKLQNVISIRENLLHAFTTMSEDIERARKSNLEDISASKKQYLKLMQRVVFLKQQYAQLINKGRPADKMRTLEQQWQKKLSQLHNEHNNLLIAIFRHNTYQRLLHERIQPALINYTESVMRLTVEAIRKLLEECFPALDVSLALIRTIDPPHEYDTWLKHLRIECPSIENESFPPLPEDYSGPLRESTLQVDQVTYYTLEECKVSYEKDRSHYRASLSDFQRQLEQKRIELAQLRASRIQDAADSCQEYTWIEFNSGMEIRLNVYLLEVNISFVRTLYDLEDDVVQYIRSAFPLQLTHSAATRNLNSEAVTAGVSYLPKLPSLNDLIIEKLSLVPMKQSSSHGSVSHDAPTDGTPEQGEWGDGFRTMAPPRSSMDSENPLIQSALENGAPSNSSHRTSVFQEFRRSIGATISRRFRQLGQPDKRRGQSEDLGGDGTTKSTNPSQNDGSRVFRHSSTEDPPTFPSEVASETLPQAPTLLPNGRLQESGFVEMGLDSEQTVDMRHHPLRHSVHEYTKSTIMQPPPERPPWTQQSEINSQQDYTKKKWFHGVLPREEISRLLTEDGDFLVRCSEKGPSVSGASGVPTSNASTTNTQSRIVLSVYQDGPRHFIINQSLTGLWYLKENRIFTNVSDLITHYVSTHEPISSKRMDTFLRRAILRPSWQLDNDDIVLGRRLGRGNFGDVFHATYGGMEVAVKTCRADVSHEEVRRKFLQGETTVLRFNHPNIVRLLGIAVQKQPIMIVMEFVPDGALNRYLLRNRSNVDDTILIKMALDVASGMDYLETHKCIHRDLAARNCLVDARGLSRTDSILSGDPPEASICVKVADFGLARSSTTLGNVNEENGLTESEMAVYQLSVGTTQQIPVKWTAPEVMRTGRYTNLCDVWSYGILLWEVFSFGEIPYPGMTNSQAREEVEKGYRMPSPANMPQAVSILMGQCWDARPERRPRFNEIVSRLQGLISSHLA